MFILHISTLSVWDCGNAQQQLASTKQAIGEKQSAHKKLKSKKIQRHANFKDQKL